MLQIWMLLLRNFPNHSSNTCSVPQNLSAIQSAQLVSYLVIIRVLICGSLRNNCSIDQSDLDIWTLVPHKFPEHLWVVQTWYEQVKVCMETQMAGQPENIMPTTTAKLHMSKKCQTANVSDFVLYVAKSVIQEQQMRHVFVTSQLNTLVDIWQANSYYVNGMNGFLCHTTHSGQWHFN